MKRTVLAVSLPLLVPALAAAQSDPTGEIALVPFVQIGAVSAITHGGDARLFVSQLPGTIRVVSGGSVLPTPFLDIQSRVASGGERGLLSAAFHPKFPAKPYFYVNYTSVADAGLGIAEGDTIIARFRLSESDPNVADPNSGVTLLHIAQPFANHNGGQIKFGPDGYLYIAMGDGGAGGDPACRAQRHDTLLGKMLRIDIEQGFDSPPYYGIPPTNPFVGPGDPPDEVWALGLRNPWRFSFDRSTGDLFIGDVGQSQWEEVSFQAAGTPGGRNFGWNAMEGSACFDNSGTGCPSYVPKCGSTALTLPIIEYSHDLGCSITSGYRYRGSALPGLAGAFVYADFCSGRIWGARESSGGWTARLMVDTPYFISTFGQDVNGELYVGTLIGSIFRVVPGPTRFHAVTPCRVADTRQPAGPSGGPPLAANTTRSFPVAGLCGIPEAARAVALNATVVQPGDTGNLRLYALGDVQPSASTINFAAGRARANNSVVGLGVSGRMAVRCDMPDGSTATTHALFDVFGYYQ
jgi:hypothetical protein